jgi:hypothetical protein
VGLAHGEGVSDDFVYCAEAQCVADELCVNDDETVVDGHADALPVAVELAENVLLTVTEVVFEIEIEAEDEGVSVTASMRPRAPCIIRPGGCAAVMVCVCCGVGVAKRPVCRIE